MTLPLNVAVSTSTPTNEADGAAVALKGQTFGNEYTGTVGADGKLSLGEVWRDVYKVTVSKTGFTTFAAEHDATKGETATVNAVLDEYRVDPFGLEVSKTSTAGQRKFDGTRRTICLTTLKAMRHSPSTRREPSVGHISTTATQPQFLSTA